MNFRIRRTPPSKSDKRDERNLMWLVSTIILCWGTTLNVLTTDFEPLKTYLPIKKYGSLLSEPYVKKNRLYLSEKIKISLKDFEYLDADRIVTELRKGDTIWYVPVMSTGIFDQLFGRTPKVVAFGTKKITYLSIEDYNNSIPRRKEGGALIAIVCFLIPFIYLFLRYGFIDKKKKEFGLHFYQYK